MGRLDEVLPLTKPQTVTPQESEIDRKARRDFELMHLVGEGNARRYADGAKQYIEPGVQREWQLWVLAYHIGYKTALEDDSDSREQG